MNGKPKRKRIVCVCVRACAYSPKTNFLKTHPPGRFKCVLKYYCVLVCVCGIQIHVDTMSWDLLAGLSVELSSSSARSRASVLNFQHLFDMNN